MYVKLGIVRYGYQHMAFLSPESKGAAEASECAAEQGRFWEYHDKLFASQGSAGGFSKDKLKTYAAELKLDPARFNSCIDSGKYSSTVENETASAQAFGITSTPAFLINGQPLVGAQPFEKFQQIIEAERSKKK
jgi:protein-disulfide isomerase